MNRRRTGSVLGAAVALVFNAATAAAPDLADLTRQVTETERAFARSMADRDLAAFEHHLSVHAIFYDGKTALRGPQAIVAAWKRRYESPVAPFSWEPDQVDVLADGMLAHSSGPVRDPTGKPIARFHSVWRQESPGVWRIVFDRGEPWRD